MWAILVEAWEVKDQSSEPMQPKTFLITCDAHIVRDVVWAPFTLRRFAQPRPKNTFEATINWVYFKMDCYTDRRMDRFSRSIPLGNLDTLREALLCPRSIVNGFQLSRKKGWALEQMCFIIDSVAEEHFVFCRENHCVESDEEDIRCSLRARIKGS